VEGSQRSDEAHQENGKSAVMVRSKRVAHQWKGIAKTEKIAYQYWFGRKRGESVKVGTW